MTTFPGSPKLLQGGLVLLDPRTAAVTRVVPLQYNPDSVSRTLQAQSAGGDGDRPGPHRLKGPPVETIRVEAELDATDALERGDPTALELGLYPQLAALETIVYPDSRQLTRNNDLASAGTLEIIPVEAPLTLFVWSKTRIVPVRLTEFSVTEEAFDPTLNPIRAKVSLSMRVLSVADLGFASKGGNLFLVYQQQKERLAARAGTVNLNPLGIGGLL